MNKISLVVDSSFGLTKEQCNEKGLYFIPIIVDFEGQEYESGISINNDFLVENMTASTKVKTAAVRLGDLEATIREASENSEKVIVLTLSKHLSSINSSATLVAKDFDNVHVYDSQLISPWTFANKDVIINLANEGKEEELIKVLDTISETSRGYLVPHNLDSLYAGGRISKVQYLAGNLLKVQPIITVEEGRLDKSEVIKERRYSKAIAKVVELIKEDMKDLESKGLEFEILTLHVGSEENHKLLLEKLNEEGVKASKTTILTPAIVAHTGPGTVAVAISIKN